MIRDPFGCPSRFVRCNRGHTPGEFRLGLTIGLDWHDGPALVLQAQFAGWWCYATARLWYSERMWQRSCDRWNAECLAGEHQGIRVGISPANGAP